MCDDTSHGKFMTHTLSRPTLELQRKLESCMTTTDVPVVITPSIEDRIPPTLIGGTPLEEMVGLTSGVELPPGRLGGKGVSLDADGKKGVTRHGRDGSP